MALGTIAEEPRHSIVSTSHPARSMPLTEKISKIIIESRCTDGMLFYLAASVGSVVFVLQTLPVFMNNWVLLTEPRPVNKTSENGELMEATFRYNTGYFQICRYHQFNESGVIFDEMELPVSESSYQCYLNPLFSRDDLGDLSLASLAVIMRLGPPAALHITGAFICSLALLMAFIGHMRKTVHTLVSSICYICGSIVLCIAVLMVVCVVDDELAPRMKPNAAGEPSKFSYIYGVMALKATVSRQICAKRAGCLCPNHNARNARPRNYDELNKRFPSVLEKLSYVPGLEAKLRNAQLDKEFGIPPIDSLRRGSLASYLPVPYNFSSRRSSSWGSQTSFNINPNPSMLFIQDV